MTSEAQQTAKALAAFLSAGPAALMRLRCRMLDRQAQTLKAAIERCSDEEGRQELREVLAQLGRRLNPTPNTKE